MLTLNLRDFERVTRRLGAMADQIPFALANAMNDAVKVARKQIVEQTWPTHMKVRNAKFIDQAMHMEFANKKNLRVELFDRFGRGNLLLHAKGGQRSAQKGSLAVPSNILKAKRTGRGIPAPLRPSALSNSFKKGDVIYQRVGKYQKAGKAATKKAKRSGTRARGKDGRGLKLMYVLKPSVPIRSDVPFQDDFNRVFRREVMRAFGSRIRQAMATRR